MSLNIEQLKKKIIYRSNYRGTKEMDKLLGAFTKTYINILNYKDLMDLEKLLDIDDANLYKFFNGLQTDFKFEDDRENDIEVTYKSAYDYHTTLEIPEGYGVDYLPKDVAVSNEFMDAKTTYETKGNTIIYTHQLEMNFLTLNTF